MRLWTVQDKAAYDDLCDKGILRCDSKLSELLAEKEFIRAYDWLKAQMKEHIGEPPLGVEYPIWAWYLLNGKNVKPDLRRMEFNNYVGEHYIIEVEIPDKDALISDEEMWHLVLNNGFFGDDPTEKWMDILNSGSDASDSGIAPEGSYSWYESLPMNEQKHVKQESWKKIFDKGSCPWVFVQATFWELRKDHIVSVRQFTGKQRYKWREQ